MSETTVDLTNCDREPIHILGAVQPIGFLLALDEGWVIERASANTAQFIGQTPEVLIGRRLEEVFSAACVHNLRNRVSMLRGPDAVERIFGCRLIDDLTPFDVGIHMSGETVVIEAEPARGETGDATNTVRSMIARIDLIEDMPRFFNEGARLIRAISGFDRVMVYRFAKDGSGEVVAEAARHGIGSFKGLHYPATDIPAQARDLYKRNL